MSASAIFRLRTFGETALGDPFRLVAVALVLLACGALVVFPIAMLVAHGFIDGSGHYRPIGVRAARDRQKPAHGRAAIPSSLWSM